MLHTTRLAAAAALLFSAGLASADGKPVIGLITKTETNPFFVKMKEGADAAAKAKGAKLLSGAGKTDGDNAGQVTAMENMIAAGAKTILITPSDSKAIIPAIKKARDKGVMVIALDSPTDPAEATDARLATDNYKTGVLIGQHAKQALAVHHGASSADVEAIGNAPEYLDYATATGEAVESLMTRTNGTLAGNRRAVMTAAASVIAGLQCRTSNVA